MMEEKAREITYVPFVRMVMVKERELPYALEDISGPDKVVTLVRKVLEDADREYLLILSMDTGGKLVAIEVVSIGALNKAIVEPREVFKHVVLSNAAEIVMAHNHPSGRCSPSDEDIEITERIKKVEQLLGIPLADHIIIGDDYFSFREERMLSD